MNRLIIFLLLIALLHTISCNQKAKKTSSAQLNTDAPKLVGGRCDGCEIMYVGMPAIINTVDTSPAWREKGQKLMVTGTAFQLDGKTVAPNVVIYYYHTDNNGYYSLRPGLDEKAKRHGHIRGWVKTDDNGKYAIYTIRPAPYPNDVLPAHIHLFIKEPDVQNEYYTDEINFDDDKLLLSHFKIYPQENRGGSGIVRILPKEGIQIANHNMIVGLNIPNYPKKTK